MRAYRFLFAALCLTVFSFANANAADVKALVTIALKGTMADVVPIYEKASGNKVAVEFDTAAGLKKKIDAGETFDLAILTPVLIDDLVKAGKVAADSKEVVVRAGLSVGIKAGAKKPDISTSDAFKKSLLAAKSIGYTDPALGGASGVYISKLVEKLGIADDVKAKTQLTKGSGPLNEGIASGSIEIGVTQTSELLTGKDVEIAGPLPADIQNFTVFASGVSSSSAQATAAKDFVKTLTSSQVTAILKTKGLEPGK